MTSALASALAPSPQLSTSALPITSTPPLPLTLTLISTLTLIFTHLCPLRLLREACRSFVRELYVFALSEWAYSQVSRHIARSIAEKITLVGRPVTQSVSK